MNFDDVYSKKKDKGPTIDTLDLDVDHKIDFFDTVHKNLQEVDSKDNREYKKRVSQRRLKLKIKMKEQEKKRRPTGSVVTIGAPVDSDEEFTGRENYDSDSEIDPIDSDSDEKLPKESDIIGNNNFQETSSATKKRKSFNQQDITSSLKSSQVTRSAKRPKH